MGSTVGVSEGGGSAHDQSSSAASGANPWIVGPTQDKIWLIGAPWLALVVGAIASVVLLSGEGLLYDAMMLTLISVTMGHVFAVFFRSHCNQDIFVKYRFRFTIMPILVLMVVSLSNWGFCLAMAIIPWWDVVHQAAQTRRIGRMYDTRVGIATAVNDPWERGLTLLLYAAPLLAGLNFIDQVRTLAVLARVNVNWAFSAPSLVAEYTEVVSAGVVAAAILFLGLYAKHIRGGPDGALVGSKNKWLLYASTGLVSVFAWGFNSFGLGILIMTLFHGLQYLCLVWHAEKESIRGMFDFEKSVQGDKLTALAFVALPVGYGVFAYFSGNTSALKFAFNILITGSILHYWYDGFIWREET